MHREPLPPPDVIRTLPPDGGPGFNRLIHETSPYLLQHARNPVDWHPWGEAALARARAEDKPVFLSVGYSSCHWCHVMEHESFENPAIAEVLNRHFIPVKVDREERPDIDDLYMIVTQLMTGRGGWPNSVWLLPDGRPWYAGTYFPPEDRGRQLGFRSLLLRLAEIWTTRRTDVEQQAAQLADAIHEHAGATPQPGAPPALDAVLQQALDTWTRTYDMRHGGFGTAPKFPPHSTLDLLLHRLRQQPDGALQPLVTGTLDAMALGGIHDHVGGGFHRYSTDQRWLLPHFEKMLYDNAQLAPVYAEASALLDRPAYAAIARATLDWVLREMTGPEGGFFSALDADSEGEEGRFYVWSHDEALAVLGPEDGAAFCRWYAIAPAGNFHDEATGRPTGLNIPHLAAWLPEELRTRMDACRAKLLAHRARRVWPGLDDKRLTAWNGLMISALARSARALNEPRYMEAAQKAAAFLLSAASPNVALMRVWRAGEARIPGFLDDYAALANGLLDLHETTGEPRWRAEAARLTRELADLFFDAERGQFLTASPRHETLMARLPDYFDQAVPSSTALAIRAIARLADNETADLLPLAQRAFAAALAWATRMPSGCAALLHAGLLVPQSGTPARSEPSAPAFDIELHARQRRVHPGQPVEIDVEFQMPAGWHLQLAPGGERYAVAVEGDFTLVRRDGDRLTLMPALGLFDGWAVARFFFTLQLCDDRVCRPPETCVRELTLQVG
jgi:uncharacterized protein YyaL (SSP411 family)